MKKLRVGFLIDDFSQSRQVNELIEFIESNEAFNNPVLITGYKNNNNDFKIIDPYNGLQDIKHRVLRSLHSNSYINDPKRIFRAARYSARYNLNISKKEVGSIILGMNNMHLLTKQQIDKEKQLINNEDNHVQSFALLKEWGYH